MLPKVVIQLMLRAGFREAYAALAAKASSRSTASSPSPALAINLKSGIDDVLDTTASPDDPAKSKRAVSPDMRAITGTARAKMACSKVGPGGVEPTVSKAISR